LRVVLVPVGKGKPRGDGVPVANRVYHFIQSSTGSSGRQW
jgi:hypothetical protein